MDSFGDTIRNLREMRGWTQKDLAERSGIHPRTVFVIEDGGGTTMATAVSLAAAFDLPLWKIIKDAEQAEVSHV